MEGIEGVLARVGELQGRLATLTRPTAAPGQFDALLDQQTRTAPPAAPAAAGPSSSAWALATRPAALRAAPAAPPAGEVVPHPNGRIPDSALVPLGDGERLQPAAATAFLGMRAAAAVEGVALPVNDSYRSLAEQEDMARRKGLYSEGGLAARPGTSTHGLGLSVDLQLDDRAQAWMRENGARFGFREDVPREPWHWTYTPAA